MRDLLTRAVKAATFDRRTFDEVMWERNATADAVLLVAFVSALRVLWEGIRYGIGVSRVVGVLVETVISDVAGWLFLAVATWFLGSRLFRPGDDFRRRFEHAQTVMRVQGIAYLPMVLAVFGGIVAAVGQLWYLAAASVGTAVALDVKPLQGGVAVILGMAALFLIRLAFGLPFLLLSGLF